MLRIFVQKNKRHKHIPIKNLCHRSIFIQFPAAARVNSASRLYSHTSRRS
jgi:hypothetical protein